MTSLIQLLPADASISTSSKSPSFEPQRTHSLVSKEERFGEDFDRSWPRARTSPVQSMAPISLPSRAIPPQMNGPRHSPTDGSPSGSTQSPQDGTSPTSRVLFNERSNRLEPWSKPRLGPGQVPAPMSRRNSREDHSPFSLSRQQPPPHLQGRDVPPHPHPSSANVQFLQKGLSSADSSWKGGPPRGFGHETQRGRWSNGSGPRDVSSSRDEQLPWNSGQRLAQMHQCLQFVILHGAVRAAGVDGIPERPLEEATSIKTGTRATQFQSEYAPDPSAPSFTCA